MYCSFLDRAGKLSKSLLVLLITRYGKTKNKASELSNVGALVGILNAGNT